jgi:general stress protein 26
MERQTNLNAGEGIKKLKQLVDDIDICLFCTDLKTDDGATCRPMSRQEVDEDGSIWFFSEIDSDKNIGIQKDNAVQLFFSHPGKNSYLVVNGVAEIFHDRNKIEALWTPVAKVWFKEGKEDPNISLIKVTPSSAYYWDTEGSKMVNILKFLALVVTGKQLIDNKEGEILVD